MTMRRTTYIRTAIAAAVCLSLAVLATPVRADFLINETTAGDQRRPDVGSDAAGNFVVVWSNDSPAVGYDPDIFARRFDANGMPLGTEFQVNTNLFTITRDPHVAVQSDGKFFVVWSGLGDGEFTGIGGRRYDASGNPEGADFVINTYTTDSQLTPQITGLGDDEYVVVWAGFNDQDGDGGGVFAQRFDAGGAAGSEFQINATTTDTQQEPRIAKIDGSGAFVAIYEDYLSQQIRARRFDSAGVAQGTEFTAVAGLEVTAMDGLPAGGFVVAWGSGAISGQLFDGSGFAVGTEIVVSAGPSPRHAASPPAVAAAEDGRLFFAWEDTENIGRRFDALGEPLSDAFVINTYTSGFQGRPVPQRQTGGDFVVVWHSFDQDGQGYGNFGRRILGGAVDCPAAPLAPGSCRGAGRAKLDLRDKSPDSKDSMKWSMSRGDETLLADFGDPVNLTPFAGCLYADGVAHKTFSAPAAALCDDKPCWRDKGSKGFSYRDRDEASMIANGGTSKVSLRPGEQGKVKLQLRGKGAGVVAQALLPLPITTEAVFQLINANGECWSTSFAPADIKRNDAQKFQAKN